CAFPTGGRHAAFGGRLSGRRGESKSVVHEWLKFWNGDMTEIAAPATRFAVGTAAAPGALRRFGRWLGSGRLFPRIPFLLVELLFILVIFVPFLLTIYISVLKWRANRPFETAYFSGPENYEAVLTSDLFWLSIARTFYFAGVAVVVELVVGFVLA